MANFLVLNGANLNMLGEREPTIYGATTLAEINAKLQSLATQQGHQLESFQSNAEHDLINQIHRSKTKEIDFIIINPGAFCHTSIALRDAFSATETPFIEVHLSNIFSRESFRKHSYLSDIAKAVLSGFGAKGYELALVGAIDFLADNK